MTIYRRLRDEHGQDWIRVRTEANFHRIRTGSDWENFCCLMWLFWKYPKF